MTTDVDAFTRTCRHGLDEARALLPELVAGRGGPRTVEDTAVPHNRLLMALERTSATASLVRSVHPDPALRAAAEACEQEAASFLTELMLDPRIYAAFAAVDVRGADADTRRLVERVLRDYRRAGVDRDETTRVRLKAIDDELVRLGQVFAKHIIDDVRSITLRDPAELAGLPADFVAGHPPDATGAITITTNTPDYLPFMSYAEDGARRRELYVAARSRGDRDNEPVLGQILALRREKAGLLGYASWADYATEDKMMKSGAAAADFIERVAGTAAARAEADHAELLREKRQREPGATRVDDWEKTYLENKVKAAAYDFDPQAVRPYFPYAQVVAGLLEITGELYELTYRAAPEVERWDPTVDVYEVERHGVRLGRIYLDMHPREGKYQHAAQFTLRSGVRGEQVPEGVLVCNFPDPRGGPALLEHDDVVTMFHEFGHLMHHVLGGAQRWIYQSGVATEWDFVEAPSQMFEEWAWRHETLARFARHVETGAPIPAELVARMRRADKFGVGLQTVQQMFYAAISLRFHTLDPATLDMRGEIARLQARYTPFAYVEGTSFHCSFGHLEGYSALYYTYMWSLVIAKDLLTPFEGAGLMDPTWAARYRDRILAAGGTRDAADLVEAFLGRPFGFEAFEGYLAA